MNICPKTAKLTLQNMAKSQNGYKTSNQVGLKWEFKPGKNLDWFTMEEDISRFKNFEKQQLRHEKKN